MHPVKYGNKNMTAMERYYTVFEIYSLDFIFPLRKLIVYVLSTILFTLVTDYNCLEYVFQKKDIHGLPARWMNFLA